MLRTRIITAIFLLLAFLGALFCLPEIGWVAFVTLVAAIAGWEWGALMRSGATARLLMGVGMAILCAAVAVFAPAALGLASGFSEAAWLLGRWFYLPAALFWILVVPLWMTRRWVLPQGLLGLAVGALLILPAWLALVQLREAGGTALLGVMAVVWLADIAAYFFGRTFGKHKLAPSISPGKTWEGAIGAGFAVLVYGFVLSSRLPPALTGKPALLAAVLLLLTAVSVIGDLFESLLKRQAGLKDSSNVLPGHGGVLDRIDSLTSTLPLVALVWLTSLH